MSPSYCRKPRADSPSGSANDGKVLVSAPPSVRVEELRRSYGVDEATSILFEKQVPVVVRRADREAKTEELSLRVALTQPTAGGAAHKTLRVALTSEVRGGARKTPKGGEADQGGRARRPQGHLPPKRRFSKFWGCTIISSARFWPR